MTMTYTIEKAVYPLLLTASILGLPVYSPKKLYLRIFYNITIWIAYGYIYYYIITMLKAEIWFQSTSYRIYMQIGILATIVSIVTNVYQNKVYMYICNL